MINLYVNTQGVKLGIKEGEVYVEKEGKIISNYPSKLIRVIFLFGNINLTTPAIKFFLKNQINVIFLSSQGDYIGMLKSIDDKNYFLKYRQYEIFNNEKFINKKNKLIRIFLDEKINNQYQLLYNHLKNYSQLDLIKPYQQKISELKEILKNTEKFEDFIGIEGYLNKEYFNYLKYCFRSEDLKFHQRTHYPPKDEINSLLSFGYTLIINLITGFIYSYNLDPYIGFLHKNDYYRPNLSLDIIEPFRSLIDKLVLKLINLKIIKKEDFEKNNDKILIKSESIKKIIAIYESEIVKNEEILEKISEKVKLVLKIIYE